ncbi:hypothetical protein C8R45DRAFT_946855 [Mycena sanguinolenta]|nr:hypothetical protein C8R45DRAFT_946855 [Mycena sanguinolenta]
MCTYLLLPTLTALSATNTHSTLTALFLRGAVPPPPSWVSNGSSPWAVLAKQSACYLKCRARGRPSPRNLLALLALGSATGDIKLRPVSPRTPIGDALMPPFVWRLRIADSDGADDPEFVLDAKHLLHGLSELLVSLDDPKFLRGVANDSEFFSMPSICSMGFPSSTLTISILGPDFSKLGGKDSRQLSTNWWTPGIYTWEERTSPRSHRVSTGGPATPTAGQFDVSQRLVTSTPWNAFIMGGLKEIEGKLSEAQQVEGRTQSVDCAMGGARYCARITLKETKSVLNRQTDAFTEHGTKSGTRMHKTRTAQDLQNMIYRYRASGTGPEIAANRAYIDIIWVSNKPIIVINGDRIREPRTQHTERARSKRLHQLQIDSKLTDWQIRADTCRYVAWYTRARAGVRVWDARAMYLVIVISSGTGGEHTSEYIREEWE